MCTDARELAAVVVWKVGTARAAPLTVDDSIPAAAAAGRAIDADTGLSGRRWCGGYLPISAANMLTVEIHCSYTGGSMLTRMSTATITMGIRMIPSPGVGGVRAQA